MLYRVAVQYNSWHAGASTEWTGKKSYWLEEVGHGRAEGSLAIGDQANYNFTHVWRW